MLTQSCIILAIVVYLCGMLYIGISFSRKNSNTDDFYLGGRTLGPFVTAMSAEASDMSSYLLMGLPGLALSLRPCRCGLDGDRAGGRHLSKTGSSSPKRSAAIPMR